MHSPGKDRHDRLVAGAIVVIVHALLAWTAHKLLRHAPPIATAVDTQLYWIVRAPPPAPPPPARNEPRRPQAPARRSTAAASAIVPPASGPIDPFPAPAVPAAASAPASGLSADFVDQARRQADRGLSFAARDPFARAAPALPGAGVERFRMAAPRSPQSVLRSLGRLFGGGDPAAPCRELNRQIEEMAQDGDSPALQEAYASQQRWCR
ncbi:hypothetical protein [Lysobacter antibioticus]|uniref:hypothetical protein n=1 Tax=Lysobacter antibioticus TaxID=84531 RepID=UPI00034BDD62|nr:hypothetical protein [Lysobacter antibioticus]